jgi:hypothetical protein
MNARLRMLVEGVGSGVSFRPFGPTITTRDSKAALQA